jgi:aspartyl aminopeptidase
MTINKKMMKYIDNSPTAFHAVENIKSRLLSENFTELKENERWDLAKGGNYFVTRNDSALIAFTLNQQTLEQTGFTLAGAHTDSPALKLKPQPQNVSHETLTLTVEPYGGGLWDTWFDRELSLAGRISYIDQQGNLQHQLIDLKRPIAIIPSLAIHLQSKSIKEAGLNKQTHLPPLTLLTNDQTIDFYELLSKEIQSKNPDRKISKIMASELYFYPTLPAQHIGWHQEFIAAPRLDNLLSCFVLTEAIIGSENSMAIFNDHEEVGSVSTTGASGSFLEDLLKRIGKDEEALQIIKANSTLLSVDNAHAVHPNYPAQHDPNHLPKLNQGVVIKINANQRYASTSQGIAQLKHLAQNNGLKLQTFVANSALGCGSTIGPISSAKLGIETIDIGVPSYAMHSIRELVGDQDTADLLKLVKAFYNQ